MRLWSLDPKYLDCKGLVACWREACLSQKSLKGLTKGYKNHPQLNRFKKCEQPLRAIGSYLTSIYIEAKSRGYNFNSTKIDYFSNFPFEKIYVTKGQIDYEVKHLQKKLLSRDFKKCCELTKDRQNNKIKINKLFTVIDGDIEKWEKV